MIPINDKQLDFRYWPMMDKTWNISRDSNNTYIKSIKIEMNSIEWPKN